MPSLCFPSPGSDAADPGSADSVANRVPRPYNSGGYAGTIDPTTMRDLQAEADGGNGAALFAADRQQRGSGLWLLLAVAAGVYFLSDNR